MPAANRSDRDDLKYVELEPFRAAFARKARYGLTPADVADRMGLDRERVRRLLHETPPRTKRKRLANGQVREYREPSQRRVEYSTGVKLANALDVDPHECGV